MSERFHELVEEFGQEFLLGGVAFGLWGDGSAGEVALDPRADSPGERARLCRWLRGRADIVDAFEVAPVPLEPGDA